MSEIGRDGSPAGAARHLRILILNQYALPKGSPGITRHGELATELVRRGHAVTIVASGFDYLTRSVDRSGARSRREERIDGVRTIWLRTGRYRRNDMRRTASMLRYLAGAALEGVRSPQRPDVVIGSSPNLLAGAAALLVASYHRVPFVFEARDFWPSALVDLGALRRRSLTHRALCHLERLLYRRASRIVSVPPEGWRRVAEVGEDSGKVVHIPNVASAATVQPMPVPHDLSEMLAEYRGRFVIVHAGAQGVLNGLDTVVSAAALLRDDWPDVAARVLFLMVGAGQMRPDVEAMVRRESLDNFKFWNAVPKGAIPAVLAHSDGGLVSTARADYFRFGLSPNKLFDYMAAGLPVLIAAQHPTLVDVGGAGLRYVPGDARSLAEAVARLVGMTSEDRSAMGRRGQAVVASGYTLRHMVESFEELLLDVTRQPPRG